MDTETTPCFMAKFYLKKMSETHNILKKLEKQGTRCNPNYLEKYREEYRNLSKHYHENMEICQLLNNK